MKINKLLKNAIPVIFLCFVLMFASLACACDGSLIGPDGGQITSSDGKVKVIIPPAALETEQCIEVQSINATQIEESVPSGKSLLSVVDCTPSPLAFNQTVSLVYTLDQPEVPGTPVELNLYSEGVLNATGVTAPVASDGRTLTFSIDHFSTYAALKTLTPQGIPIGAGVKIPVPDMLTGSFSHGVSITMPPGRKGMQPQVGITYRSSSTNSWIGLGFGLNSGYIVRSTKLGPPSYNDTQDTFYFISDAGTTELTNLIDNLYQAKIESGFTKFFKEADDTWRVVAKDGSVLRFGETADSRETAPQGTFSWHLTRAQDTNSNYIQYSYVKDQGKTYLSQIDYTGNTLTSTQPKNKIEFILESRSDSFSSYISRSKIETAKRLKTIRVLTNEELVWRYELEYDYSPDTSRSLLKSITQYAADNTQMPKQEFSYQEAG